ncbi:MAG: GTP-binding protein [Deltaproteobacteria bacterium]|jgi:small GTP-binding protein|nr:GTP-binding protein [Deltaproteobacteria bacterium]
MINKKICMLGAFCVGKTALVRQYVNSIFSDNYLSTVGVKISKKVIKEELGDQDGGISLVLWDMEGQDNYSTVNLSYLRGAHGLLFVVDGTRGESLSVALKLRNEAIKILGQNVPGFFLINKADLQNEWEITDKVLTSLSAKGVKIIKTSAKTGLNVEKTFEDLTQAMLEKQ